MAIAIALILITVGSIIFHFISPWWITPLASNWKAMDDTLTLTFVVTGIVFVAVNFFIAYCVIRFKYQKDRKAAYEPENKKLEWWLTVLTSIGIVIMLAPGLWVYAKFVDVPEDAYAFEVVGQQWKWSYRFPGEDGVLGNADPKLVSFKNPFGLRPDDPNAQDDVLVLDSEVHLPINTPILVLLRSKDVLHDFYVPHFRVKMDLVPGIGTSLWFTPTKIGRYDIACAEYCGMGHHTMRGLVVIDEEPVFQQWLRTQTTFAQTNSAQASASDTGLAGSQQGQLIAQAKGCLGCHSVDGSKSIGPGWKGLYGKTETLVDGNQVVVDKDYLIESITDPSASVIKGYSPIMPAYDLSQEELDSLIAYTIGLSDQP